MDYTFTPLSEKALVVQFENLISEDVLKKVLQLKHSLDKNPFPGYIECVSSYSSLTVYYNPLITVKSVSQGKSLSKVVEEFIQSNTERLSDVTLGSRKHIIPTCYDVQFGMDIVEISRRNKISNEEIVNLHTGIEYTVFLIGFTPGFPYLGSINKKLECERLKNPRKRVPVGSVAIAGKQTGIYPSDTPGGWNIIGRTPIKLFNISSQPSLLKAGDKVVFNSISKEEFNDLSAS